MALIHGSSMNFIKVGSGKLDGFCKSFISPLFIWILYTTPGVVVNRFISNSLSSLSVTISKCNKPKKPHLKPKPKAEEDSVSKEKLESFNFNFANPSFNFWYSELSTGNNPQKTTGLLGLKPGNDSDNGLDASQIVSPTFVSDKTYIPVVIKPISPEFSSSISFGLGVKTPTFSTKYS